MKSPSEAWYNVRHMSSQGLKVISLNIQHGWNTHVSPRVFIPQRKIVEHLEKIVSLVASYDADVVLLQEVDRTSPLTRKIDQLSYIQSRVGHRYSAYGGSSEFRRKDKLMYSAGCGIISRYPLSDVQNVKFDFTFPTPRKGFITATISPRPGLDITLASVHLVSFDILKPQSRHFQIEQLAGVLQDKRSLVLGGDLNGSMRSTHMKALVSRLAVTTHNMSAHDRALHTFPSFRPTRRIDWILTSPHLPITDYRTFTERVSDHRAVGTTISV